MPQPGFKSITVSDAVYDKFYHTWKKNKEEYGMKGVNSFSGYITHHMSEMMYSHTIFKKHQPRLEKLVIEDGRILIKDNRIGRVAEIILVDKMWTCQLCNRYDCSHIGFCYSLHEFYLL